MTSLKLHSIILGYLTKPPTRGIIKIAIFLYAYFGPKLGENNWKVVALLEKNDLARIRQEVENCIGKKVTLKANKGRKRFVTREGIVEDVYPNLFVVKINNKFDTTRRVSYTYSDILTETVEVTICNESSDREENIVG